MLHEFFSYSRLLDRQPAKPQKKEKEKARRLKIVLSELKDNKESRDYKRLLFLS